MNNNSAMSTMYENFFPLSDNFLRINSLKFNSWIKDYTISKTRIIGSEVVNIFNALGVTVDFYVST